jgi:hypothetical protein
LLVVLQARIAQVKRSSEFDPENEVKAASGGERLEITVARKQRNAAVHAALGYRH